VSKTAEISPDIRIVYQISCANSNLVGFVEKSILDLMVSSIRTKESFFSDFSFVLEKLNKHLREFSRDYSVEGLSVFLSGLVGEELYFSILGRTAVYFVKHDQVMNIAQGMDTDGTEFSYVSSGAVAPGNTVFISNIDLLDHLSNDDLVDISRIYANRGTVVDELMERETGGDPSDVVIVYNDVSRETISDADAPTSPLSRAFEAVGKAVEMARKNEMIAHLLDRTKQIVDLGNPTIRKVVFGVGVAVSVTLLYLVVSSVFSGQADTAVPEEYRQKLVDAAAAIQKASKEAGNPELFRTHVKQAEDLIFEVRDKQLFMTDVTKLLGDISVLKKEANGIESFNLTADTLLYGSGSDVVGVFEDSKRYYFLMKESVVGPYVHGGETKTYPLPDGEDAVSGDMLGDTLYVLTASNRVLKFYKGEFSYVNVSGQQVWQKADIMHTYNSNLYLLSSTASGSDIARHRPGVNGFSAGSSILADNEARTALFDFVIDGGFYLLRGDLMIDRIVSAPSYARKSLVINKLPDGYKLPESGAKPRLFLARSPYYLYVLLGNTVWIFEPNSKRFQDITSLTYVGQLEPTGANIHTIYVPEDGTIVVGTDTGEVHTVKFEVADGKILVR
jgi:hypothetical protein